MTSYCEYCNTHPEDILHKTYHDMQYGFPLHDDNLLFERLLLEINQAGLAWTTILKKAENFRRAYSKFNIAQIAKYTAQDRARLLNDSGIIRNRLKINAAIVNAQQILELQTAYGSFRNWLDVHRSLTFAEWAKLFKKIFTFTGSEIVREFLLSTGYLAGAHAQTCPIYERILQAQPAWMCDTLEPTKTGSEKSHAHNPKTHT